MLGTGRGSRSRRWFRRGGRRGLGGAARLRALGSTGLAGPDLLQRPADLGGAGALGAQHHLARAPHAGGVGEVLARLDRRGRARRRQAPMRAAVEQQLGRLRRRADAGLRRRDGRGNGWRRGRPRRSARCPWRRSSLSQPSSRVPAASSFERARVDEAEGLDIAVVGGLELDGPALALPDLAGDAVGMAQQRAADGALQAGVAHELGGGLLAEAERGVAGGGARHGAPAGLGGRGRAAVDEQQLARRCSARRTGSRRRRRRPAPAAARRRHRRARRYPPRCRRA